MNWVSVECVRRRQHPTRGDARSDDATILITVEKLAEINHDLREFLDEVHELSGTFPSYVRSRDVGHKYKFNI